MEDTIRRNASPVRLEPAPSAGGAGGSCSSLNSSNSDDAIVQPRTPGANSSLANRLSFNSAQNFMTATAAAQQMSQHHQQQQQQQQHHHHQQQVANAAAAAATAAAGKVLRPNQQLLMHSYSTNDASVGEYKFTVNVGQHLIKITGDCCELVRVSVPHLEISYYLVRQVNFENISDGRWQSLCWMTISAAQSSWLPWRQALPLMALRWSVRLQHHPHHCPVRDHRNL